MPFTFSSFFLKNRGTGQTVAKNTAWLVFGSTISRLIRSVMVIYAARVLGTEGYGVFAYVLSLIGFFAIFSDFGLSGLLTRQLIRFPEKLKEYLSTTFILKLIILGAVLIITIFVAPYFSKIEEARALIPIVALLLAFDNLRMFGFSITRAQNRMEIEAILTLITDTVITVIGLAVLFFYPSTKALAIGYTIGSGIGFLIITLMLWRQFKLVFSFFRPELVKPILSAAWPFALTGVLGGLMINIDMLMIGVFRQTHELGLYGASQRLIQLLYLLPGLFAISLFPIISKFSKEKQISKLQSTMSRSITVSLAIALPIVMGGILVGQPLINLIFGKAYLGSVIAFQILMITLLFVFPGTLINNAIFAIDKQKLLIFSSFAGAILNILFDLLLIPSYGIAGSAVATVVTLFFVYAYNWYRLRQINTFPVLSHLPKILIATAGMSLFTWALLAINLPVLLVVTLSALVYITLLWLLKEPLLGQIKSLLRN